MSGRSPVTRRDALKRGLGLAALPVVGCGDGDGSGTGRGAIVRYAIHPAIGVARVGNSASEFFFGQEVPGPLPEPPGGFRDASGALKRQAARFRVYGYDAAGAVVREVTAAEAEITWTVELANHKAAWYAFSTALDIPSARPAARRNPLYTGTGRQALAIEPGPRSVSGAGKRGPAFDTGTFLGAPVYLGELSTDEAGRLVVLGGRGASLAPRGEPLTGFANNAGWCDDLSDGPVRATLAIDGGVIEADPAWVVVAPPNFAPAIAAGFVSLYDVVYDAMRRDAKLPDRPVSFADDIHPLLARVVDMQWVNAGVLRDHGPGTPGDYLAPELLARLGDPSPANAALRAQMFDAFRDPAGTELDSAAIPPMYGDEASIPAISPRQFLAVTPTQHAMLARWRDGDFVAGLPADAARALDDVPVARQPASLDRAALEACLGGSFHPGCEATWPLRVASMYAAPFRLIARAPGSAERDYGDTLTPAAALASDGPLHASAPGSLTRWMAVPWQADTLSCRSGFEPRVDPYLPTFWPARVPNHVLTEADYRLVMDASLPREVRVAAFLRRAHWLRDILEDSRANSLQKMLESWHRLGLVAERPGPTDLPELPQRMKVEAASGAGTAPASRPAPTWGLADA